MQEDYCEQMGALTRYYDEVDDEIILLKSRMHEILQLIFSALETLITPSSVKI